jgi:hypothetical protein
MSEITTNWPDGFAEKKQEALLLTTARLVRAHLNDHLGCAHSEQTISDLKRDIVSINEALAPFDGSKAEPVSECATEFADDPYHSMLNSWKKNGGIRPGKRPDDFPTRCDTQFWTKAEVAISNAMEAVEAAGASAALTDAVNLLSQARDRVADHVEGIV